VLFLASFIEFSKKNLNEGLAAEVSKYRLPKRYYNLWRKLSPATSIRSTENLRLEVGTGEETLHLVQDLDPLIFEQTT
jgi:hypothetical protein